MRQENPSEIRDFDKPKNHHGFVYVRVGKEDKVPLWEMRKPTPDERLSIIESWIRKHGNEGPIKSPSLPRSLELATKPSSLS